MKIKIGLFETKYYYNNDNDFHNENGPAIEYKNGTKLWYYNGIFLGDSGNGYTQKKFEQWLRLKAFQ